MSGEKILIVDDEWEIGDILKLHFEEEGYVSVAVQSVDAALKEFKKGSFASLRAVQPIVIKYQTYTNISAA